MSHESSNALLREDLRIDGCEVRDGRKYLRLQDWVLRGPAHPGFMLSLDVLPYLLPDTRLYRGDGLPPELARPSGPAWERFIEEMEAKQLLETATVAAARAERLRGWRDRPVRPPVCAGRFYPEDRGELVAALERCFLEGPGRLPGYASGTGRCRGIFAPHADLETSGSCAAYAYLALADAAPIETYLLIGPSHAYYDHHSEVLLRDMATPLGTVPVDRDLAERLVAASQGAIQVGEAAQSVDHSLEMQLPFLQYLHQRQGRPLRIVPLLVNMPHYFYLYRAQDSGALDYTLTPVRGAGTYLARLSEALRAALGARPAGSVGLVISGDLTHYGSYYNFTLSGNRDFRECCQALDGAVLDAVESGDPTAALRAGQATNHCGIYALHAGQRALDGLPGRVLDYRRTGALADDGEPDDPGLSVASLAFMDP